MVKGINRSGAIVILFITLTYAIYAHGEELYFIDAHSQVGHKVVPLRTIISLMKQGGVSHTILTTRGKLKGKDLVKFASKHRNYITPAVRTKGKPYDTGSPKYYKMLKAQVLSGKYSAIAETLLYHAQKGDKAPEYEVYPDDKRVVTALEYAIDNGWPFVVHIEFGALHGKKKKQFMISLERMLYDHPEQPFVLTHMGQLKPSECKRLIELHRNIHFHTGWTNPVAIRSSKQPWANLFDGGCFTPEWREIFIQYPERFVFALDNVFSEHWSNFYVKQMKYWKKAMAELPVKVAHLIAHGNAERLWHIPLSN